MECGTFHFVPKVNETNNNFSCDFFLNRIIYINCDGPKFFTRTHSPVKEPMYYRSGFKDDIQFGHKKCTVTRMGRTWSIHEIITQFLLISAARDSLHL